MIVESVKMNINGFIKVGKKLYAYKEENNGIWHLTKQTNKIHIVTFQINILVGVPCS